MVASEIQPVVTRLKGPALAQPSAGQSRSCKLAWQLRLFAQISNSQTVTYQQQSKPHNEFITMKGAYCLRNSGLKIGELVYTGRDTSESRLWAKQLLMPLRFLVMSTLLYAPLAAPLFGLMYLV